MARHLMNPFRSSSLSSPGLGKQENGDLASGQFPNHCFQRLHALAQPLDKIASEQIRTAHSALCFNELREIFRHIGSTSSAGE